MTLETKIKWLKRWSTIRVMPLVPLALMMPRNRKKIVFGAWAGRTFSCNPKYLFEYFAGRGGFTCVWIGGMLGYEKGNACRGYYDLVTALAGGAS